MDNVYILLSTYNGEKFLEEQLKSLKKQTGLFQILVRDDGSSDNTLEILSRWEKELPIKILKGENIGVIQSFQVLLQSVPKDAEYIFFCDQDDIWEENKITKSIEFLKEGERLYGKKIPLLFHSDLSVIDDTSKQINPSLWKSQRIRWKLGQKLNRLVMQNTVTGCSMMINSALLGFITEIPKEAKMHDWWCALVACSFGKIISSEESLIRYRIHGGNVVGARAIDLQRILNVFLNLKNYIHKWRQENQTRTQQVEAFYKMYKTLLPLEKEDILRNYLIASEKGFLIRKLYQIRYQYLQQGWFRVIISFLLF